MAFKVECILKENQLHYKVHWLGYDMTNNSWVTQRRYRRKYARSVSNLSKYFGKCIAKHVLHPRHLMPLVVQQCVDLNVELYQHAHKHLQIAERTWKLPQHMHLYNHRCLSTIVLYHLPTQNKISL